MEKKIVEGYFYENGISIIALILGVCLVLFSLFMTLKDYEQYGYSYSTPFAEFYVDTALDIYDYGVATFGGLLCCAVSGVLFWLMSKCSLVVTDKRVSGSTGFGQFVDLPVKQVSAVNLGIFKSIGIASSSGVVHFWFVENRQAVRAAIIELSGMDRSQNDVVATAVTSSNADELRKYKELLDSGVISQEEFDAKKKQLLGL